MKYISFSIMMTIVLVAMAQVGTNNFQKLTDGVWLHKSKNSAGLNLNTLVVEEDSTITLVDIPATRESALKLKSMIKEKFGKEVGQLIISSYSQIDTNLIEIFQPEVIHDFKSVVKMMGAGTLVKNDADLSVAIGNFTVFDATPRLSMLFPGETFSNNNLIVFNIKDKLVYLGSFQSNNSEDLTKSERKEIQESIKFIEKNTEECEMYLARTGKIMDSKFLSDLKSTLD